MGPVLAVSLLWLAQAAVEIAGGGGCPEPAAVTRKLIPLLPAASSGAAAPATGTRVAASPPPPTVRLARRSTGELDILLVGPDGQRLDEKDLEAGSACEDLAAAAAVVIATWLSEPEVAVPSRVDLPPPAAPAAGRDGRTPAEARPAAPDPSLAAETLSRPSEAASLRLGAVGSSTSGQWAGGLRAGGGIRLWGDRWGLGVVAAATMPRSQSVGSLAGAARWTRAYLGAGPEVTVLSGPVTLRAQLQGLLAVLHVSGNGLEMATSETALRFGAGAGVWSAWRGWGGVWPWIGADLLFWPGRDRLRVEGLAAEGSVPGLEVQVAAGLGIGLFP